MTTGLIYQRAWNGTPITRRAADGYISATAMCRANGKKWNDFFRLDTTTRYLEALSETIGVPVDALVQSRQGRTGGTWVHPTVAIELERWVRSGVPLDSDRWDDGSVATVDKWFPRTEIQIVRVLLEAFSDQHPCPQFFCQGYRIDLYLAASRIAIEVDEYQHRRYADDEESRREAALKAALGCSFVRFDPHSPEFNLGTVIREVRQLCSETP